MRSIRLNLFNFIGVLAATTITLSVGCDPDWPSAHSTCEVRGQVTLDGEPLVDAKVVFVPQKVKANGEILKLASGVTDNRGEFSLEVNSDDSNQIRHDRYRVIISKRVNQQESLHSSYNSRSVLTYKVDTQEAFDRPKFELVESGTL